MRAGADRRAGEGAGLVLQHDIGGGDRPVVLGAELDLDHRARGRAGGAEHLVAGHHQLHRRAGLARKRQRERLQIDGGLAAEAAADLGRGDPDVGDVQVQHLGAVGADHELALARAPDLALAVRGRSRRRRRAARCSPGALPWSCSGRSIITSASAKPASRSPRTSWLPLGDVRGLGRLFGQALGEHVRVQQRRVGRHRRLDVDHVRQDLVVDLDQIERRFGDRGGRRGDRGDGVAVVQRLAARHHVQRQVAQVRRRPRRPRIPPTPRFGEDRRR